MRTDWLYYKHHIRCTQTHQSAYLYSPIELHCKRCRHSTQHNSSVDGQTVHETVHENTPSRDCVYALQMSWHSAYHITPYLVHKWGFWCEGDTRVNSTGSLKSTGFVLWVTWMFIENFIVVYFRYRSEFDNLREATWRNAQCTVCQNENGPSCIWICSIFFIATFSFYIQEMLICLYKRKSQLIRL